MTEHVLSLSYGKDSLACLGAIEELGWPLDRIIHAEIWATDTIPADLTPMVEFKARASAIIKKRWGVEVEPISAGYSYEDMFYKTNLKGKYEKAIHGFPMTQKRCAWCNKRLKIEPLQRAKKHGIWYLGIACDEPQRFGDLCESRKSPLVELGWTEADCRKWCEENDLLSPIYTTATSHDREALVSAHISKYFGGVIGSEADNPLPTVTAIDHNGLCAAHVAEFKGQDVGQSMERPLRTITTSAGEFGICRTVLAKAEGDLHYWPQIRELLNKFCGYELKEDEVLLLIIGGIAYYIADITLRMLTPRELYNAMGFPPDYIIDRDYKGNPYPKTQQVARCGNAVCPPIAEAMVRANLPEWCRRKILTMKDFSEGIAI